MIEEMLDRLYDQFVPDVIRLIKPSAANVNSWSY